MTSRSRFAVLRQSTGIAASPFSHIRMLRRNALRHRTWSFCRTTGFRFPPFPPASRTQGGAWPESSSHPTVNALCSRRLCIFFLGPSRAKHPLPPWPFGAGAVQGGGSPASRLIGRSQSTYSQHTVNIQSTYSQHTVNKYLFLVNPYTRGRMALHNDNKEEELLVNVTALCDF